MITGNVRFWTAAVMLLLVATPALAQQPPPCAPAGDLLRHLDGKYGERPAGRGLSNRGVLVLLTRSADGATWTLMALLPDGTACLLDGGEDWQAAPLPAGDPS